MPIRASGFGRLRQSDQQCGLCNGQAARFLAEISTRGGANAFQIAPKGRPVQVNFEYLFLAKLPFQRQSKPKLTQLTLPAARWPILQNTRNLHG